MTTLPQLFAETVAAHPDRTALRWKVGDAFAEWTWTDYADAGRPARGRPARPRRRARRPGRAHAAQPPRVPRRRHGGVAARRDAGVDLQLLRAGTGGVPRRPLGGRCRDRRGHRVPRTVPQGAQRAARRCATSSSSTTPTSSRRPTCTGGTRCSARRRCRLDAELGNARPDDLLTIIYTSGTTGPPKGVTLDHENMDWTMSSFREAAGVDPTGWRVVSYLPMAHVAERTVSHYMGVKAAYEVTTCPDPGLLVPYLVQTRPQFFFAVPRVWEKAHAALRAAVAADPAKAEQLEQALEVGWQVSEAQARGEALPDAYEELWALIGPALEAVRAQIGLDQVEIAMTGAAPIPFEILQFFRSLGVPLSEVYGLSETSGPMTWTPFRVKVGTVGPPMPGVEVVLGSDGEVLTRGGNVFRGYLNAPEQTAEVFDADGWFHTGDIGVLDADELPQDRRPQEGAHHHRGRQEHLAGEPRSRAEGGPADRAGVRDRRQPAVHLRAAGARRRRRTRLGQGARHRRDGSRRARRASRRAGRSRARSRRGERAVLPGREGQALDAARARSGSPTRRSSRRR